MLTLDAKLAMASRRGQESYLTEERTAMRDNHLRAAAERFNLTPAQLATELARYHTSSWQREKALDTCPPRAWTVGFRNTCGTRLSAAIGR